MTAACHHQFVAKSDMVHTDDPTLQSTRLRALGPGRPLRPLTVDGTLDRAGDVHLPLLLQIQL